MIHIVDYKMGNLRSAQKAFKSIDITSRITADPDEVLTAEKLVLPGVGHFSRAMNILQSTGLADALNQAVMVLKTPILGICLGMQLMTEFSEEGNAKGLGWVNAEVTRFALTNGLKIPHMGWNRLKICSHSRILGGITEKDFFYFVHSYFVNCANPENVLARTEYGNFFVSAFQHENIFGCQFHPRKES